MPKYADSTRIKEKSAIDAADLDLEDSDSSGSVDDDFDDLIEALNEQASDVIDSYCRRTFTETTETITIDGNNRSSIRLPGYPVSDVSSVKDGDGNALDSSDYRIKRDSPALPGENSGILERKGGRWIEGWENYEITYTWGYSSPPSAIVKVAEELVIRWLKNYAQNNRAKPEIQSVSMDGFSVTYDEKPETALTEQQKTELDPHRRVIVA